MRGEIIIIKWEKGIITTNHKNNIEIFRVNCDYTLLSPCNCDFTSQFFIFNHRFWFSLMMLSGGANSGFIFKTEGQNHKVEKREVKSQLQGQRRV
jgi:hypothetical protein